MLGIPSVLHTASSFHTKLRAVQAIAAAAPEDGAEREPEALAVLAAATVPLAALLEPSFAEGSSLVETAALAFESGEDADDASVTVAVRLNPEDE